MPALLEKPVPKIRSRATVLAAFFAIYVIWGSTYLAIRYAVETIPPLFTAGIRHLTAGLILLTWGLLQGRRPTWPQWRASIVIGALFFLGGHGSLHWAEKTVPSGLAALLIATEPMIVAVLVGLTTHRKPLFRGKELIGLLLGLFGVGLLIRPGALSASGASLTGALAVLAGAVSWSTGIIYGRRSKLSGDTYMMSTLPLLTGAVQLLLAGLLVGEYRDFHLASVSAASLWGLLFLIVFGSIVAFTAYNWLLERYPPTLVATHTYVNPIVAILLGWGIAHERLDANVLVATLLVIGAIALVHRAEKQTTEAKKRPL